MSDTLNNKGTQGHLIVIEPNDTATKNDLTQLDRKFELHWHSLQRKVETIEQKLEDAERRIDQKMESLPDRFIISLGYLLFYAVIGITGILVIVKVL